MWFAIATFIIGLVLNIYTILAFRFLKRKLKPLFVTEVIAMINNNDVIKIELVIKDHNTKEVLDTTLENIAKGSGIYDSKTRYEPLTVVFSSGELLKGVEENIRELEEGKEKEFTLTKDKAFGDRNPKLIQLIPQIDFKKEKIDPKPGMHINLGNKQGKVLNVSGGRVQVDFNPEFAGRDLDYKVTLKKLCTTDKDKAEALFSKYFFFMPEGKARLNTNDSELEIVVPGALPKEIDYIKYLFIQSVFECCGFSNVKFSENYERQEKR